MFYIMPEKAQKVHLSSWVYGFHVWKTLEDKSAHFQFFSNCSESFPFQFFTITFELLNLCVNNYFQSGQNKQSTLNDNINNGNHTF